jgi:nickel-dependent lactate racemase
MRTATQKSNSNITGRGGPGVSLTDHELRVIVGESLSAIPAGSRVLAIVPDKTRDDNTSTIFPFALESLGKQNVKAVDVLIAQGTHGAMTSTEKAHKIGIDGNAQHPFWFGVHDHKWNDPGELVTIGELDADTVRGLSDGLVDEPIALTINRRFETGQYDVAIIFGAVVPHEVAGFAGGAKYLFPGVCGREMTNFTHWIGALAGIENVIGRVETPARHLIEAAADHVSPEIICISSVFSRDDDDELVCHAMFGGDFRASFRAAAQVSSEVHIKRTGRKYRRVVALLDDHYDELWTGGKASYKLGGIIEEGGELIIYAPHLHTFSTTHGKMIERHGYAPVDAIKEKLRSASDLRAQLCVAAHLAHVAYASKRDDALEPRFKITLASQISEARCRSVNLGYLARHAFDLSTYDDIDTLIVKRAGRDLYLL